MKSEKKKIKKAINRLIYSSLRIYLLRLCEASLSISVLYFADFLLPGENVVSLHFSSQAATRLSIYNWKFSALFV